MQVILLDEVEGLGFPGDVVNVRPGYGRNYLIPQGLATPATQGALKDLQVRQQVQRRGEARQSETLQDMARRIEGGTLVVRKPAGSGNKLYGAVTAGDIALALREQLGLEIERRRVALPAPIKTLGSHDVSLRIAHDVHARFTLTVVREGAPLETSAAEPATGSREPGAEGPAPAEAAEAEAPEPPGLEPAVEAPTPAEDGGAETAEAGIAEIPDQA